MQNISITIEVPACKAVWLSKLFAIINESESRFESEDKELAIKTIKEIKELIEKFDFCNDKYSPSPKVEDHQTFIGSSYSSGNTRV